MIFLCLTVAALVLALLSLQGFHEVDEGVRGTACFSAQLVQAPAVRSAVWVPFLVSSESTVFDLVRYSQLWSIVKVPENEPVGSSGPSFWTAFTLGGCASIKTPSKRVRAAAVPFFAWFWVGHFITRF